MLTALTRDLLATQIIARLPPADRWRLRCASKRLGGSGEPDVVEVAIETAMLVGIHTPGNSDAYRQVQRLVIERLPFGHLGPLRRWFRENKVHLDEGGFYTPLGKSMRVRIGLWETGVVHECKPVVKRVRGKNKLVLSRTPVAKEGFVVYAAV